MKHFKIQYLLILILAFIFSLSCDKINSSDDYNYGHGFGMGSAAGSYGDRESMKRSLRLNDAQADKISKIDSKYREKYYKNRGNYDKIEALRKAHKNEINGILNKSQQKKFDELYNYRWRGGGPDDRPRHMNNRGRGGRGHMMGW